MSVRHSPRVFATAVLAGLSLLLTGCFITPGKFVSELVLVDEDRFTFTYEGEIFFLAMSDVAGMAAAADQFEATCYDDSFETRDCTDEEIAEQRAEWDAGAAERAAESAEQAAQARAMLGGIDPSDPEASAELVAHLLRQKGWQSIVDKGDGVFDVRYSVSGTLGHDFMFPVIEGFPTTNPFVQMILREGNVVRVNAPGFAANNDANPMSGMMAGMGGMAGMAGMAGMGAMQAMGSGEAEGESMTPPDVPVIDGTFRIVTNGRILANNTDEGPIANGAGEVLEWTISPRTSQAPTALVDLSAR